MSLEAAICLNRFGLGARPGELARITDPKAHLMRQLANPQLALINQPNLLDSAAAFQTYSAAIQERRAAQRQAGNATPANAPMADAAMADAPNRLRRRPPPREGEQDRRAQNPGRLLVAETVARMRHAVETEAGFLERWTLFWANHFTMAGLGAGKVPFAGPFEREAIRPNVLGRFSQLLLASSTHPGMLVYLDQASSIGPNSPAGGRARNNGRNRGLNENLAREILELHTLGVNGGYSQADVTEFARALTGWTIVNRQTERFAGAIAHGNAIFVPQLHEPDARQIMGRSYGQNGQAQALAILSDLAGHPATARNIATKLARHFIADTPPPSLVARLEASFMSTGGDLKALAQTLIDSPECWLPLQAKFKTPLDFMVSTLRASNSSNLRPADLRDAFEQLGQPAFRAPSPEGWPDDAASWAGPDAILKRVDWSNLIAERIAANTPALPFIEQALGATLTERSRIAISRAETHTQAITLALMSPEFQRR